MRLLPERKAGSQPRGQWVLSNPAGPSCSLGNLMLKLKCTSDVCFRIPEKNDFGGGRGTLLFSRKRLQLVFLFYTKGHSRFSATPVVPVALLALGTFQGPGVIGVFLAGEPLSGLNPPLSLFLSAASSSFLL